MSHVKSNFNVFTKEVRDFSIDELATMTTEQFDALPLSDQVAIYNHHPEQYARLTGRATEDTATATSDNRSHAEQFADEFERRINDVITRAFHPQNGSNS